MKKKTKKIIIAVLIFTIVAIMMTLFFTDGFTVDRITGKVYNVQNVFDEIWNLMQLERQGEQTLLTKYDPNSKRFFDFGSFDGISIPMCNTTMFSSHGPLRIYLEQDNYSNSFEYDCRTKILTIHGSPNEDNLNEFLTYYFNCQNKEKSKTKYSLDYLGEYTVEISPY